MVFLLFDAFAAPHLLAPDLADEGPIEIEPNREELVVVGASVKGKPLLQHEGTADLNLDVETGKARLDKDSFDLFPKEPLPAGWGKIRVFSDAGSPCRINLKIYGDGSPEEIEVHLSEDKSQENPRTFRLTPKDADLRVEVELIECRRKLRIGKDWEKTIYRGVLLQFVTARGTPLLLAFDSSKRWEDMKPAPELFDLSQLPLRSLRVKKLPAGETRLAIESRTGKADLHVDSLRTAGDHLRITGTGPFSAFGTGVPSLLASRHPFVSAAIILALLAHVWPAAWLVRALPRQRSAREGPPAVFISYSHEDEAWKKLLVKHLGVLAAEGALEIWDDRRIGPGEDWLQAIETAMGRARVAVLLVSADFLTSRFIRGTEVPRFLERRRDGLRVIPVIVHPCAWQAVEWLAAMQCRPPDGRPLSTGRKAQADADLAALALEIHALLRTGACDKMLSGSPKESAP